MGHWRILILVLLAFWPADRTEPPAISFDGSSVHAEPTVHQAAACPTATSLPALRAQAPQTPTPPHLQQALAQRLVRFPPHPPRVPRGTLSRPSIRPGMHIPPMDDDPPGERSRFPV